MSSGPQSTEEGDTLSEVNVIPLADLSLVLLIILMVLSPMIMQSMIKVHSSRAKSMQVAPDKPLEPPLILAIDPGKVSLNTVAVTDLELASRLAQAVGVRDDKTILISADPAVAHGRVVQILDLVKQHGIEKIALLKKARPAAPAQAAPAGRSK